MNNAERQETYLLKALVDEEDSDDGVKLTDSDFEDPDNDEVRALDNDENNRRTSLDL